MEETLSHQGEMEVVAAQLVCDGLSRDQTAVGHEARLSPTRGRWRLIATAFPGSGSGSAGADLVSARGFPQPSNRPTANRTTAVLLSPWDSDLRLERGQPLADPEGHSHLVLKGLDAGIHPSDLGEKLVSQAADLLVEPWDSALIPFNSGATMSWRAVSTCSSTAMGRPVERVGKLRPLSPCPCRGK